MLSLSVPRVVDGAPRVGPQWKHPNVQYLIATCLPFGQLDLATLARGGGSRHQRACAPTSVRSCCLAVVSLSLWLTSLSARAETDEHTLTVLRATAVGVGPADSAALDAALHDALAQLQTFSRVNTLPVPLEDVQLAAGCFTAVSPHEEARAAIEIVCLRLMAQQLGVDTLLVRQLIDQGDGSVLLTILVLDTADPSAEPARAEAVLAPASLQDGKSAVRLVAQLFPHSLQRASSSATSRQRRRLGWTLSAVGTGLLFASLTCSVLARHDQRSYADVDIEDEQDVDHAQQLLGRAGRRARLANVFLGTGAVVTAAGVASLLWPFVALRKDTSTAALSIQPTNSGAMLLVDGAWQGGR